MDAPHDHGSAGHEPHGHDPHHRHSHGTPPHGRHRPGAAGASERRLLLALVITGGFMLVEVAGGLLTGSLALLADAAHMLTDAGALGLAYAGARFARRPADPRRSYGYHRLEVLAAFVNGLTLLAVVVWIGIEAVSRLLEPVEVTGGPMMVVAIVGLLANVAALAVLGGGHGSLNVSSAAIHVMGDLLGSVATILAGALVYWGGLTIADPLLSLLVAGIVLRSGLVVLRRAAHVLLEGTPAGIDPARLGAELETSVAGLADIHHVHIWSLTDERPLVTLHARLAAGAEPAAVLAAVKRRLAAFGMAHSVVQLETGPACPDEAAGRERAPLAARAPG